MSSQNSPEARPAVTWKTASGDTVAYVVPEPNTNGALRIEDDAGTMPNVVSVTPNEETDYQRPLPERYTGALERASHLFSRLSPRERLQVTDAPTLSSHAICGLCFAVWFFLLPKVRLADLNFVSTAYAQAANSPPYDPKPIIYLAVFGALLLTFVVSLGVHFFGKSKAASDSAGTVSKTLLGFFVGIGTQYLGIGH